MKMSISRMIIATAFGLGGVVISSAQDAAASAPPAVAPSPAATTSSPVMTREQLEREIGAQTGLFSEEAVWEGKRVSSVSIRYSGKGATVDTTRLISQLSTKAGSMYSAERVNKDLERLIASGYVGGDTVVMAEASGDGVAVVFQTTAQKLLAGVGYRGVTAFTQNDLSEETKLVGGQALSDKSVSQALTNLRKYYHDARYPDAKISYHYQATERAGFVDVIFTIQEGKKTNLDKLEFVGNTHITSVDLKKNLETQEWGIFTWFTKSGRIDREKLEDDFAKIIEHYRNEGFLRAQITKTEYFEKSTNPKKSDLWLKLTIYEGMRYNVKSIGFGPTTVYTPEQLVKGLSLYNGDTYSAKKVSDDIVMIRRYYGAKGYADVQVTPDIQEVGTDPKTNRGLINIVYRITEGNPYRVGNINIRGNTKTKDRVIRLELPLQANDPMNSVYLDVAKKRLEGLRYFSSVEITQENSSRPGYRDVNIDVTDTSTGQVNVGVAFSSIESVYLFLNVTQSNFDLYDWGKFVGGGQRFSIGGRLGTETQDAFINWVDPWFMDKKLSFGIDLNYSRSTYMSDYYRQQTIGAGFYFKKPIDEFSSVKLGYKVEQYKLNPEHDAPTYFANMPRDLVRCNTELSYLYDSRDAQVNPRKGGKFEAVVGYSGLGGDVKTYNVAVNASHHWNLRGDTIFTINGGVASVESADKDSDKDMYAVPIVERLFLGGPYNMRGYRFRDMGWHSAATTGSETIGGLTSGFCQFEFTVPIIEQLRFATFFDVGFVNEKSFTYKSENVCSDWGIGLRINLPMGGGMPIAIDYAIPMKKGTNAINDGNQFQFYMNYAF